jgi:hypothetical protein
MKNKLELKNKSYKMEKISKFDYMDEGMYQILLKLYRDESLKLS